ncbi:hypothetical protein ACXYMU_00245 [Pontibacter sp. CAU 1760]
MKRLPLFLLLLLCSCMTSKRVKDYLAAAERQPEAEVIVADWLEEHQSWYAQKAARDFPAPAQLTVKAPTLEPASIIIQADTMRCPEAAPSVVVRRVYLPAPAAQPNVSHFEKTIREQEQAMQKSRAALDAARNALKAERIGHETTRKQLRHTEGERDYWEDKNEKKFWALIVMAVCAVLYIVFKTLAARVGPTE